MHVLVLILCVQHREDMETEPLHGKGRRGTKGTLFYLLAILTVFSLIATIVLAVLYADERHRVKNDHVVPGVYKI